MKPLIPTILLALSALPAQAQNCAPHDAVVARLAERYGETRQSIGLTDTGAVLEVFAAETGTWTIIVTGPDGLSCLVAAGRSFRDGPFEPAGFPV